MTNFSCGDFTMWYYLAEDVMPYTTTTMIVSSISIIPSIVLNTAILIAIVRTRSLHTPQNIFMCNLAVSNLGLSCLGIPLWNTWKLLEKYHHDNDLICFFAYFSYIVSSIFCGGAFTMIAGATMDRYLALRLHLAYATMVTNTKTIIFCMVVWVNTIILSFLLLIGRLEYTIAVAIAMSAVMLSIVYCYLKIFHILRRHHNQIQSQMTSQPQESITNMSRYRKSVMTLVYMLVIYIAFYAPYFCSLAVMAFQGVKISGLSLWSIGVLLLFVNSFVNPLFHCLKFEEIRIATRKIIFPQKSQIANSETVER